MRAYLRALRLVGRHGLTPTEQIERNLDIAIGNSQIAVGLALIVLVMMAWRLAHQLGWVP